MPDIHVKQYIIDIISFALTNVRTSDRFYILLGKGNNGKSAFLKSLQRSLEHLGSTFSASFLTATPTDKNAAMPILDLLQNKIIAFAGELPTKPLDVNWIKNYLDLSIGEKQIDSKLADLIEKGTVLHRQFMWMLVENLKRLYRSSSPLLPSLYHPKKYRMTLEELMVTNIGIDLKEYTKNIQYHDRAFLTIGAILSSFRPNVRTQSFV
ncbi:hypothetical protein RF11_01949 [Thelohanellus kitauei]|uniref:Uncharacterized protein n=1 Tax=Thelohanellus kitauei TaxID=669202 RepID=A0A0C2JFB2_THEKT|nr:hypothetical protein RF11_01949 [Thelohanellus kitauei]